MKIPLENLSLRNKNGKGLLIEKGITLIELSVAIIAAAIILLAATHFLSDSTRFLKLVEHRQIEVVDQITGKMIFWQDLQQAGASFGLNSQLATIYDLGERRPAHCRDDLSRVVNNSFDFWTFLPDNYCHGVEVVLEDTEKEFVALVIDPQSEKDSYLLHASLDFNQVSDKLYNNRSAGGFIKAYVPTPSFISDENLLIQQSYSLLFNAETGEVHHDSTVVRASAHSQGCGTEVSTFDDFRNCLGHNSIHFIQYFPVRILRYSLREPETRRGGIVGYELLRVVEIGSERRVQTRLLENVERVRFFRENMALPMFYFDIQMHAYSLMGQ